ncbi:BNR repeat-like domain protein [uncultured archaeon]|nr:BNR repeat-like domain protein [uncultured archaeon]
MKKIYILSLFAILTLLVLSTNFKSVEAIPSGFSIPINISTNQGDSILPQMVVSGNNVYIVWNDNSTGKYGILFTKSTDGGITFGTPVDISRSIGSSGSPQFAVSGKDVYSVWQAKTTGKYQIIFAKSTDGGATFSTPANLSNNTGDSSYPKIVASGNNIYITWSYTVTNKDYDVLFAKSDDRGSTFSVPVNISNNLGDSGLPQMSVSENNVYVTWENNGLGNFEVFVAKSNDNGNTFAIPINISNDAAPSGAPQIIASGKNVYVSWMDKTPGNYDVFVAKSNDAGSTFSAPVNVSNTPKDSGYEQITASGNNIYVVWTETISDKNYDVLFAKSTNGGSTFDAPVNISHNDGASGWALVSAPNNIYVAWEDNTPGNYDIFVAKSTDGGSTFGSPVNVSNTPAESAFVQMVATNDSVYLVWHDGAPNQHDVLFTKSTTFVPEFGALAPLVLVVALISIIIIYTKTMTRLKIHYRQ